jgi:hypothetical protein
MQADGKRQLATGPNPNHGEQSMPQADSSPTIKRIYYVSAREAGQLSLTFDGEGR